MSSVVMELDICPQSQENYPVIKFAHPGYARGLPLPWRGKMGVKIILAHLSIPYGFWAKIHLFRHGNVAENLPNLQNGFEEHLSCHQQRYAKIPEYCLELEPGDSVGRDHPGGVLNNMRLPPSFWEGTLIQRSGFYTNRLTMAEMVECPEKAAFLVEIQKIAKWETLPIPKNAMNAFFRDKSEDEQNICTFYMVLEKK